MVTLGIGHEHLFQILHPSCSQDVVFFVGGGEGKARVFLKAESDTVWPCGSQGGAAVAGAAARALEPRSLIAEATHVGFEGTGFW